MQDPPTKVNALINNKLVCTYIYMYTAHTCVLCHSVQVHGEAGMKEREHLMQEKCKNTAKYGREMKFKWPSLT